LYSLSITIFFSQLSVSNFILILIMSKDLSSRLWLNSEWEISGTRSQWLDYLTTIEFGFWMEDNGEDRNGRVWATRACSIPNSETVEDVLVDKIRAILIEPIRETWFSVGPLDNTTLSKTIDRSIYDQLSTNEWENPSNQEGFSLRMEAAFESRLAYCRRPGSPTVRYYSCVIWRRNNIT
jgi:hypothetical protein